MQLIVRGGQPIVVGHAEKHEAVLRQVGAVATVRRAGYVLPATALRRCAFRTVRLVASVMPGAVRCALEAWTRTWPGCWIVQLRPWVVGKSLARQPLGPFDTYGAAVKAEEQVVMGQVIAQYPPLA